MNKSCNKGNSKHMLGKKKITIQHWNNEAVISILRDAPIWAREGTEQPD